jgi:DNA-binding transcriptional ArsR family regulator
MSLESLKRESSESLLRFVWRQWSQLGVAGNVEFPDRWMIDPEALLAFTLDIGRYDPRLFDQVVDWTIRNGRLLSIQRLKNITDFAGGGEVVRTLSAFAAVVDSRDPKSRWGRLACERKPADAKSEPFFLDLDDHPLPVIGELDGHFLQTGYLRAPVQPRGMMPAPIDPPTNLLLRLRSVFGLGPRAEVLAYLLTRRGGQAGEIARATRYSHTQVLEALAGFAQAGVVTVRPRGRQRIYAADVDRWLAVLDLSTQALPSWVDWPRILAAVSEVTAFLRAVAARQPSNYLLKSDTLSLSNHLREMLADTGLTNPFEKPLGLEESADVFPERARSLVGGLARGGDMIGHS